MVRGSNDAFRAKQPTTTHTSGDFACSLALASECSQANARVESRTARTLPLPTRQAKHALQLILLPDDELEMSEGTSPTEGIPVQNTRQGAHGQIGRRPVER